MKKLLPFFCFFLASCAVTKQVDTTYVEEMQQGMRKPSQLLIVKRDGTAIFPTTIKYPNHGALKIDDNFIFVDGVKMYYRDMSAFQNEYGYTYISRNSNWKTGKLMTRFRGGKINMYVGTHNREYTEYFIDKNGGEQSWVSYEALSNAVADNPEVISYLQKVFPKKRIYNGTLGGFLYSDNYKNMMKVIELYNQ